MIEIKDLDYLAFSADPTRPKAELKIESNTTWVSLIGNSGVGKTTFLKTLAGIYYGKETVSKNSVQLNSRKRIEHFAYMSQQESLFSNLSVFENLALALDRPYRNAGQFTKEYDQYLNLFEIPAKHLARFPRELSIGQKAKIQLFRTVLLGRSVVLLDEPFAALDQKSRMRILLQLKELFKKQGRLVIAVTHDPLLAEVISDHVLMLTKQSSTYCKVLDFASLALQVPDFAAYWPESAVIEIAGERIVLTAQNTFFSSSAAEALAAFDGKGVILKVTSAPIAKATCSRGVVTVFPTGSFELHGNNSDIIVKTPIDLGQSKGVFYLISEKNYESAAFLTVLKS